jgi:hypothetical protein
MHTLSFDQMTDIEGGGFWCGFAMGATFGTALFVSPLLGGYLLSKAIGVCLIEAAVR